MVAKVKADGMDALALTDHGNLFGAIDFYTTALKAGVKPIIGCEVYMAANMRYDRDPQEDKEAFHLLLLAQNNAGYKNLLKLVTRAYREGFYRKPRIDKEILAELSEGLICTSTCLGGEVPQALARRDQATARQVAETYLKIFGPDRFFIELQDHGMEEQRLVNPELVELAGRLGVGLVATNDVHYLDHADHEAHDVLCCINTNSKLSDPQRFKFPGDQFYLKTRAEMADTFRQYPEALDNTARIAEACNVNLEFGKLYPPTFRVPKEVAGQRMDQNSYLTHLCEKGLEWRYGKENVTDTHRERLTTELGVIQGKGFSGYFLIVWDFVRYARENGIPCGARGSGVGTMVGYLLGLSHACPLEYDLLFERFMDPSRNEMPDIDIDICQDGRAKVIDYVREKYGHVAQVVTYGTLKARAVIRDVGRVLDVPLGKVDQVAKLVPERLGITLKSALSEDADLKALYDADPEVRRIIDLGRRLEGLARHTGIHAAAVVVADKPLVEFLPLSVQTGPDGERTLEVTQFDGPTVAEKCGLLKMDFLGLRTLSVIERACQLAERTTGKKIDVESLEMNDPKVLTLFASGQTSGIFQFESGGMRDVLTKIRPDGLEDLIAANALYRPGPMELIDTYVARKRGERWEAPHPIIEEITRGTHGIMVYQEQVMRVFNRLGGIELTKAYKLIKAISKKQHAVINEMKPAFIKGGQKNGLSGDRCEELFELIMRFAGYGFNKSHSTGYAIIAYQTGYLKTYYPVEYMAALLTYEMVDTDKVGEYIEECRRMGINILPPDANTSDHDFTVITREDGSRHIRFGIGAVKGVGAKAVEEIMRARAESGPFTDIFDFCERVDHRIVNRGVIDALIKCGGFDSTRSMRRALVEVLDGAMSVGQTMQEDRRAGQMNLFGAFEEADKGAGRPPIPEVEWAESEMLAHEKAALGFYVTSHPLAQHSELIERFATSTTARARDLPDNASVVLGGMITRVHERVTKQGRSAGRKMASIVVEDLHGQMEGVIFAENYEKYRSLVAVDTLVFLKGEISRRGESPQIRASEVIALEDGPRELAGGVVLRINCLGIGEEKLDEVASLLRQYQGACPVFVQVVTRGRLRATIRAGGSLNVSPSREFTQAAEGLLGPGGCRLVGGATGNGNGNGGVKRNGARAGNGAARG